MNRLLLLTLAMAWAASCAPLHAERADVEAVSGAGCINPSGDGKAKRMLENGIRDQVRFADEPEVLRSITDRMAEHRIPALSLAVIRNGGIEWADVYQVAALADEGELDCTSIFQAASLSKPVTFMAAVRMQAAGVIDLDADIETYLEDLVLPPGRQTPDNPVTFRNLFAHTSGISPGGYEGYVREFPIPSDLEILEGGPGVNSPAIAVVAPPGETLAYSGGAYTLAELALQDHFGDSFSDIMTDWLLEPIGMTHATFAQPLPASERGRVARGHALTGEVVNGGWHNYPEQAAAGLWSNAADLARFLVEIYKASKGESALFSQADIRLMLSHERDGLVYGFIVRKSDGGVSLTHYGGNAGYRTGMTIDLATGDGLAYLINSDNGGALGNELLLSAAEVYGWQHFRQTIARREQVSPDVLRELAGVYRWNDLIDLSVTFAEGEGRISLHFPNGDAYELTPIVGNELDFIHASTGVAVSFLNETRFRSIRIYGQVAVRLDSDSGEN